MKKLLICFLVSLFLVGCNLPLANLGKLTFNLPPQAWIDAPLDHSQIPLEPYRVIFHGSDPGGVMQGELSVNGEVLANPSNADQNTHLVVFRTDWNPPAPGEYTLRVRTLNSAGAWSHYAEVHVVVGESTPTNTPTPTLTTTPTLTLTSTSTPTSTPTSKAAELVFINTTQPNQVRYGSCTPNQLTFEVTTNQANGVAFIVLFTRLQDTESGNNSGWDAGTSLVPQGNGVFRRSVNTSQLNGSSLYKTAQLAYQFVATAADGKLLGRSQVYSDVLVTRCGMRLPVPGGNTITPTSTFEIIK